MWFVPAWSLKNKKFFSGLDSRKALKTGRCSKSEPNILFSFLTQCYYPHTSRELVSPVCGIFEKINHATSPKLYRSYYPHRSRDSVSPVCGIFKASALWADAFYKSICPSVCLFVCLSVCLFTFEVPFKRLFAPTSRSRMSKIFRDSESLGKSNGKKWSQI